MRLKAINKNAWGGPSGPPPPGPKRVKGDSSKLQHFKKKFKECCKEDSRVLKKV